MEQQYWLIKSEPKKYAWHQLLQDKQTVWDGVRNYAARNNLRAMKKGDYCLFYHSNEGKEIVGVAKVIKEFYQDPTTIDPAWSVVDVAPLKTLKRPISLTEIKSHPILKQMEFVRLQRLSVSKVSEDEFNIILSISEE